ncbi:O-antigen ligase family protein [Streptomyces sp. NPDC051104]|uniref:O-antigen ligase family protein n=1 Tax=Streptomyces sp. NPDC051104 TaxID=3155044 RepID=UPI00342A74A2
MIAGVVVVAVLLTGSRWISHVAVGPLYISDVLMCAAFLHAGYLRLRSPKPPGRSYGPGILVGLLLLMTAFRLLAVHGDVRLAARDAAPFAYAAIAYVSAGAYQRASDCGRERTLRLLYGGLLLHLGWTAVATFFPKSVAALPSLGGTRVLEIRTDFDVAVLGVLVGMSILRMEKGRIWRHATVAIAALVPAMALQNRAGILACCACVLVAVLLRLGRNRRLNMRAVLVAVGVALALTEVLPMTPTGQRLLATNGAATASQEVVDSAVGTKRARLTAWSRSVEYTMEDPVRASVGVGFGTDFLQLSNADLPLGRGVGLRAPHNYLVTVIARLGIAGLAVTGSLLIGLFVVVIRILGRGSPDELTSLCVLLVISITIVALLGVVLESPFGAGPFFWASGILLAGDRSRRARLQKKPEREAAADHPGTARALSRNIIHSSLRPHRPL